MAVLATAALLALAVPVAPVVAADFPAAMIDDPACGTFSGACFDPDPITILEGDSVTWTNNSILLPHTATADDPSWDTGQLDPGMSGTITFLTAGVFPYHCTFHGDMVGTVEVVAAPSAGQSPDHLTT
jgi:plastocyanin